MPDVQSHPREGSGSAADRSNHCTRYFARLAAAVWLAALGVPGVARGDLNRWTSHGPGGDASLVAVDPGSPQTVYAFTPSGFFRSPDGGQSWIQGATPLNATTLAVHPHNPTLYAGTENSGILRSVDGGDHWTAINAGLRVTYVTAIAVDPQNPTTIYAGEFEYGCFGPCLFKSTNGGNSWIAVTSLAGNPDILSMAIDPTHSSTLYVSTYGLGLFKSTDGGQSWSAPTTDPSVAGVADLTIDPVVPTTLYAVSNGGVLLKSDDAGANWRSVYSGGVVNSVAVDPTAHGPVYAGTSNGVSRSPDAGATWSSMNAGLEGRRVPSLAIDPSNPLRLYAAASGGVYDYEQGPTAPCAPGATTLCLNGGRFRVTASWTTGTDDAALAPATSVTDDAGYFTFFGTGNVELLVKLVDGCGVNGRFWFFAGGLTNVGVTLTVTDVETGAVKIYTNAPHTAFGTIQDTGAFACDGAAASSTESSEARAPVEASGVLLAGAGQAGPCVEDEATLCLGGGRYRATAQWFRQSGESGDGHRMDLTDDSGAFWFFAADNPEVVVKVLDGCGVNARQWVFAAGLTNVNVILTVTDTQTSLAKVYVNPQGIPFEAIQDTSAFDGCP